MPGDTTRPAVRPEKKTRAPRGTPTLVVRSPCGRRLVSVEGKGLVLGRGDSCDVRIDDEGLSREHARIISASDGLIHLMDLNSTNGTFVNGDRVELHVLRPNDAVDFGPTVSATLVYPSTTPESGVETLSSLTPRQLEVACLVAEGLTSAEIANRMGVSTRTITSHLDRIYTRLGISTRAALAGRIAASGLLVEQ